MANFNCVVLAGRIVRDPESRTTQNGAKITKTAMAVNKPKKNQDGTWDNSDSMFIDIQAWNNGNYKLADIMESMCVKGAQVLIQGELKQENWEDKNGGGKRSKHLVNVTTLQVDKPGNRQNQADDGQGNQNQSSKQPSQTQSGEDIPF